MATPAAIRYMETEARAYLRTWRGSAITTFLNPVLYLAALGVGLGTLVDRGAGTATVGDIAYVTYLAPGLLAATAMQIATVDSSYPVMARMKWIKTYEAALSTPLRPLDLVLGHFAWATIRVAMTTIVFALVMTMFGAATPAAALRVQLPAILTGLVFATLVTAYTAQLENVYGLSSMFRFAVIPMFLFSGTFFPIGQLPGWLQPVAYITPLWHGVELTRSAALGVASAWQPSLHTAYLVALIGVGAWLAIRTFTKRLTK